MDKDSKDKLKDVLSTIDPVEFKWDETNTTVGAVAQEFDSVTIDLGNYTTDTVTLSNNYNNYTISGSALNWSTTGSISIDGKTHYSMDEITTATGKKIDFNDLADTIETLKRRMLVLAPNFEMHEKYPMLKQMYDEYLAMEKLLSGPDAEPENM
jgi:hypothetical protein